MNRPRFRVVLPSFIAALVGPRLAAALAGVLLAGCYPYSSEVKLCGEIPAEGCPKGRGGTCEDASCKALYDCIDGLWQQTESCDGNGTGGGSTSGTVTGTGGSGAGGTSTGGTGGTTTGGTGGGCTPILFDHTGEVSGCVPDLQSPDCPAVAAEQCPEDVCKLDCNDFFICKEEGWVPVAYCDQEGMFFEAPR